MIQSEINLNSDSENCGRFYGAATYTLRPRSVWPLGVGSVWYKTTLNTGGVSVARADPQTWKMGTSFLMSLALRIPIFNNFQ